MTVDRLINGLKMHAGTMDAGIGSIRMALIATVNAAAGRVRALLQPSGTQTGPTPLASPWVGNGWGFYAPPIGGEQFVMAPQEGDGEHLIALMPVWSQAMRPPAALPGECWLVHQTGSFVKLLNTGQVTAMDAAGKGFTLQNNGTVLVTGDLKVTGNIYDLNAAHGTLAGLRTAYDAHHHTGVQSGASSTGTTDAPIA